MGLLFTTRSELKDKIGDQADMLKCVPTLAEDRERLIVQAAALTARNELLEKAVAGYAKQKTAFLAKATEICNENQRQAAENERLRAELAQSEANNQYLSKLLAECRDEVAV